MSFEGNAGTGRSHASRASEGLRTLLCMDPSTRLGQARRGARPHRSYVLVCGDACADWGFRPAAGGAVGREAGIANLVQQGAITDT
jgi:hypothetical protein